MVVRDNITMINKIKNFVVLFGLSGTFFVSVIILHIFASMLLYYISGLVLFGEEYDINRLLYLIVTTTAVISGSVNIFDDKFTLYLGNVWNRYPLMYRLGLFNSVSLFLFELSYIVVAIMTGCLLVVLFSKNINILIRLLLIFILVSMLGGIVLNLGIGYQDIPSYLEEN
jgi:hypothetical protein